MGCVNAITFNIASVEWDEIYRNVSSFIEQNNAVFKYWLIYVSVCVVTPSDDEDKQEKALSQLYDAMPEGRSPLDILKNKEDRRRIGEWLIYSDLWGVNDWDIPLQHTELIFSVCLVR